jgi:hypothetical protein
MMTRLGFVACAALLLTGCPGPTGPTESAFAPTGKITSWSKGEGYQLIATVHRYDDHGAPIDDPTQDFASVAITKDGTFAMKPLPAPKTAVLLSDMLDSTGGDWCPVHPTITPGRFGTVEIGFVVRDAAGKRHVAKLAGTDDRTIFYSDSEASISGTLACPAHDGAAPFEDHYAIELATGYNATVARPVEGKDGYFTWYGSVELPVPLTLQVDDLK